MLERGHSESLITTKDKCSMLVNVVNASLAMFLLFISRAVLVKKTIYALTQGSLKSQHI